MEESRKKRILIIGPMPPPSGGVSQHIVRLSKLIENEFDLDFLDESRLIKKDYFNIRSCNLVQYLKKIRRSDLLFIHSGSNLLRIFHLITGFACSRKIILTLHSYKHKKKFFFKSADEFFFRLANTIIIVNPDISGRISLPPEKCVVKPAFLPPIMETEPFLPEYISAWISERRNSGKSIICANAWQLKIFDNQDLYGLDMCIEAAGKLVENSIPVSFVFNVSSLAVGEDLYAKYQSIIKKLNLTESFLLLNENLSFVRLIEQSDIVLRPTNTDGDALTIREALYLDKTIIASDVVQRPSGTILFKSRDSNDLRIKILESIRNGLPVHGHQLSDQGKDNLIFYRELINRTLKIN